jgi:hypothetical protein
MQIQNALITGSFSYNGADLSNITSSNAYSASLSVRTTNLESTASSLVGASASFSSRTTQVERTYASTGSNTFTGVQNFSNTCNPIGFNSVASVYTAGGLQVTYDSYFSSSVFVNGNLTVFGTQSVVHVSSSQFNIGTNIITVNTSTPSIRYGGLSVYDSGSTGLSGSIFWDSEANHWIYANASGSGGGATYSGGMFISGPRSSGLGCEQGTTSCMLLVGQGGDHLTSSMIYHSSTATCIPNALNVGGVLSGGSAAISGSGTFGTCMTNGDFTIVSNSKPFLIKGRQTFDRGFLALSWDVSPDVGTIIGESLGFNTNAIPGTTGGIRALTLACNGAATFASSITATTGTFSGKISSNTGNTIFSNFGGTSIGVTAGNYTGISLGYSENTSYTKTAIVQEQINDGAARGHLHFLVDTANDGNNAVLGDSKMMINGLTGNVGIGNTSPTHLLSLKSETSSNISLRNTTTNSWRGITFQNGDSDSTEYAYISYNATSGEMRYYANPAAFGGFTTWYSNNAESMRLNANGYLFIGATTNSGFTTAHRIKGPSATQDTQILSIDGGVEYSGFFRAVSGANYNGNATAIMIGRNTSTLRSINAGGTINASGADYAEYMIKATTDAIAKGDIAGVNSQGKLTNIFEDSVSFVVKSTDPSYVGGDTWGSVDNIGKLSPEATEEEKTAYNTKLETERAKVDRIAFSGQVPCNVTGATVGDYIIPIELENGKIGGQAVSNPTLEQYRISVGKVWKIMEDGRAWIAVKIG